MKLKGKYAKDGTGFIDCKILIEYGKLQNIKPKSISRQLFKLSLPKNKSDFELEKISSEPIELIPAASN